MDRLKSALEKLHHRLDGLEAALESRAAQHSAMSAEQKRVIAIAEAKSVRTAALASKVSGRVDRAITRLETILQGDHDARH
jgi:hypothetical protein